MKKIFVFILCFLPFSLCSAQNSTDIVFSDEIYLKAKILEIIEENEADIVGDKGVSQLLKLIILDTPEKGKIININHGNLLTVFEDQKLKKNEQVVIQKLDNSYMIVDKYRLPNIWFMVGVFFVLVIIIAGVKGVSSLLGLVLSICVIVAFVIPQIIDGTDPLFVSIIGSFIIATLGIYLAHGFNQKSSVGLLSTLITLIISFIISYFFVFLSKLSGLGSDDSFYLQIFAGNGINLKGLLLGSIIIGALGVLDDVVIAQTASIYELKEANKSFSFADLYNKGMIIGKEHIASMINTLALAYVGTSFPLLLLFHINKTQPLWVILNSEFISEEIVRTVTGSISLLLAVPISSIIAAYYFSPRNKYISK